MELDVYRNEQALYAGTNQAFNSESNANTNTDAIRTIRSWTHTDCAIQCKEQRTLQDNERERTTERNVTAEWKREKSEERE